MKKIITLIAVALMALSTVAHDFEVDGIYYNINGTQATVTYQGDSYTSKAYSGNVTIPSTVTYDGTTYAVTAIGRTAFRSCSSLTSVAIPKSVTVIDNSAFYNCSGLASVNIPNAVTSINNYSFFGCSSLTSVTIPNAVTSIGEYAFRGCKGLTSVTIPKSVTSIGASAFNGCTGLLAVTSLRPEAVPLPQTTFSYGTTRSATLYIPAGSYDSYSQTDYWIAFDNVVELEYTANPSIAATAGEQMYAVNITAPEEDPEADLYYRVQYNGGEWSEWMPYTSEVVFTEFGTYMIEAYASADGKIESNSVFVGFALNESTTAVDELTSAKTVAGTRYYNMAGQEMSEADGMCIAVTTYTDGTTSAVKVMK